VVVVWLHSRPIRGTLLWSDPRGRRQQDPRRAVLLPVRAAILASATPPCSIAGPTPRCPASAHAASWPAHATALAYARRRLDPRATASACVRRRPNSRADAPSYAPLLPQAARVAGRLVEKGKLVS
jgi:hypothetical protein